MIIEDGKFVLNDNDVKEVLEIISENGEGNIESVLECDFVQKTKENFR